MTNRLKEAISAHLVAHFTNQSNRALHLKTQLSSIGTFLWLEYKIGRLPRRDKVGHDKQATTKWTWIEVFFHWCIVSPFVLVSSAKFFTYLFLRMPFEGTYREKKLTILWVFPPRFAENASIHFFDERLQEEKKKHDLVPYLFFMKAGWMNNKITRQTTLSRKYPYRSWPVFLQCHSRRTGSSSLHHQQHIVWRNNLVRAKPWYHTIIPNQHWSGLLKQPKNIFFRDRGWY